MFGGLALAMGSRIAFVATFLGRRIADTYDETIGIDWGTSRFET